MRYRKVLIMSLCALLIALDILFTRLLRYEVFPWDRYSLQFLSHSMSGLLFGSAIAAVNCIAGDLIGTVLFDGRAFLLPLTAVAALRGVIYGIVLHSKRRRSLVWIVGAVTFVTVICDLFINSYIFQTFYADQTMFTILISKLPFRIVSIPIYSSMLWVVSSRLEKAGAFRFAEPQRASSTSQLLSNRIKNIFINRSNKTRK